MRPTRLPPLKMAVLLVAAASAAAMHLSTWTQSLLSSRYNDFQEYYLAAQLTLSHGFAAPYDLHVFPAALRAVAGYADAFTTPPATVTLAMPFAVLPYRPALWAWSALLVAALLVAWQLTSNGDPWQRWLLLLASLALWPFTFALVSANVLLLSMALLATSVWMLRSNDDWRAGVVLGLAFLKPQDLLLVPLCVLIAGRPRAFAACFATVALLGTLSLVALGPTGVEHYLRTLSFETGRADYTAKTLAAQLPIQGLANYAIRMLLAAVALFAAFRHRRAGVDLPVAAALIGGLLVTTYMNLEDLSLLVFAGWLFVRQRPALPAAVAVAISWLVLEFMFGIGFHGPVAVEAGWVAALAFAPLRYLVRNTEDARPAIARLQTAAAGAYET